jgi:TolA-binding protein
VSIPAGVEAAAPLQPEAAAEVGDDLAATRRGHRQSRRKQRRARAARLAAAEQTTTQAEVSGPVDPEAELAAATLARSRGELEQAAQRYRTVIEHYPASRAAGAAQVALGRLLYTELGQPAAALDVLTGYLSRAGDTALTEEVLYYRGLCLQDQGRAAEARESYTRLLTQFPASLYAPRARAKLAQLTD